LSFFFSGEEVREKKEELGKREGFVLTTVAMPPKEGKQRGAVFLLAFSLF